MQVIFKYQYDRSPINSSILSLPLLVGLHVVQGLLFLKQQNEFPLSRLKLLT